MHIQDTCTRLFLKRLDGYNYKLYCNIHLSCSCPRRSRRPRRRGGRRAGHAGASTHAHAHAGSYPRAEGARGRRAGGGRRRCPCCASCVWSPYPSHHPCKLETRLHRQCSRWKYRQISARRKMTVWSAVHPLPLQRILPYLQYVRSPLADPPLGLIWLEQGAFYSR